MSADAFSPEAKMVLRLGAKYAREGDLHQSLIKLFRSTVYEFDPRFRCLQNAEEFRAFEAWQRKVSREIDKVPRRGPSRRERLISKGIRDLKDSGCILKLSDKNLGIVPIEKSLYLTMARMHIMDKATYGPVPSFPVEDIRRRMRTIINSTPAHSANLRPWMSKAYGNPTAAPFYVIPKLHKKKQFTSRPVTVSHSYILAPLSKALAEVLQAHVEHLDVIARDTKTVAGTLDQFRFVRPGVFLTYDVVALYPSIDLFDAVQVLEANVPVLRENNNFWLKVLKLVMFHNYVSFEGKFYRQIRGTATGTAVAPQFANLYMHYKYADTLDDCAIHIQRRFIDDGFLVVDTAQDAERIMRNMQSVGNLDFTYEISDDRAVFLDLDIYKGERFRAFGALDMRTYFKPTNRFLYLPAISNHPWHMKYGIVRGEAIRCLRNSTSKLNWLDALHRVFKGLIARGYDGGDIQRQWRRVRWEDRERYLYGRGNPKERPPGTLVFTRFHPDLRRLWRRIIAQNDLGKALRPRADAANAVRHDIEKQWPPNVIFSNFPKLSRQLIAAREQVGVGRARPRPRDLHSRPQDAAPPA